MDQGELRGEWSKCRERASCKGINLKHTWISYSLKHVFTVDKLLALWLVVNRRSRGE